MAVLIKSFEIYLMQSDVNFYIFILLCMTVGDKVVKAMRYNGFTTLPIALFYIGYSIANKLNLK